MQIEFRSDREEHLRKLCAEMGRSVDDFVNEAILTFMEDYEDGRDAQTALAEGGRTWTQEELEQEFALDRAVPELHQKTA
jgi:predicted DNA-binding protein